MIFDYETFKLIWLLFIGVLFIGFAVSGGFDLGVGALLLILGKTDEERRLILNSIGPTWEGNQVWFITAAGAIFAAWPILYSLAFSSFYLVFLLILLALILRPPGLDFRSKLAMPAWRSTWDIAVFLSGMIPAFLFGVMFGNLLSGISFSFDDSLVSHTSSSFFSFLSPYALLCGIVTASALLLQGSLFLQLKTNPPLTERARHSASWCGIVFSLSFSSVWVWTFFYQEGFQIQTLLDPNQALSPLSKTVIKGPGFWANNYHLYPIGFLAPILSILWAILALVFSTKRRPGFALFCNSLALASIIITLGFTLYPFILPSTSFPNHSLTIWDAASSHLTLSWMFWLTLIFLPIVLLYTTWAYRVMRGKVDREVTLKNKGAY